VRRDKRILARNFLPEHYSYVNLIIYGSDAICHLSAFVYGDIDSELGNDFSETLIEVRPILFGPSLISIQKI
jgi:hypothetical protein